MMDQVEKAVGDYVRATQSVLPTGWCWTNLGMALPITYGKALPAKVRDGDGKIPVFGSSGTVGYHDKSLTPENVIILGRKGSAGAVFYSNTPCWPIDTAYFTAGTPCVDIKYAYWYLKYAQLNRLDQSTAIPSLSRDIYDVQQVPLPPLPEQARIVARIDALLSEIADGEAALTEARKGLEVFRRALLKAAVTGELTKGWREANISSEVRGSLPKHNRSKERESRSDALEETDSIDLNDGWVWTTVDDLAEFVTSGSRGWKDFYAPHGAAFVRAQNINTGRLDLSDVARVSLPKNAEGLRTRLRLNDVLVTITGANVTVSARVDQLIDEAYVNQHVALIRLTQPELSNFVLLWLQADGAGRTQLEKAAYGAGKPGLNLDNIKRVQLHLPPPDEAAEIIRRVTEALSAADDTRKILDAEAADVARLKQAILKAAFEGKLVPQDPTDEPARLTLGRMMKDTLPQKRGKKPLPPKKVLKK